MKSSSVQQTWPEPPLDQSVRQRLLAGAARLFARKGYAAASVRELVAAAGVTKPVLYYYFGSKEGLYLALMRSASDRFQAVLDEFSADRRPVWERIQSLVDTLFSMFLEEMDVARLLFAVYYGPPQGVPDFDFKAHHLGLVELVRDMMKEGIEKRDLKPADPLELTWAVLGPMHLTMHMYMSHPEKAPDRQSLSRALNLVYRGLAVEKQCRG
ncbi:MAG: TetR/AcrR family transcriptional regulator [Thermodesulfobacteriota bacterium]